MADLTSRDEKGPLQPFAFPFLLVLVGVAYIWLFLRHVWGWFRAGE